MFDRNPKVTVNHNASKYKVFNGNTIDVVNREKCEVLDRDKNVNSSLRHQRHLYSTNVDISRETNVTKSELDSMFERRLNSDRGGAKGAVLSSKKSKKATLGPNLKTQMKKPQTPKSKHKPDHSSKLKFKSVRDMFIELEKGRTLENSKCENPKIEALDIQGGSKMTNLCTDITASISPDISDKKLLKGDVIPSVGNVSEGIEIRVNSAPNRVEKMPQKPLKIAGNFDQNIANEKFQSARLVFSPTTKPKKGELKRLTHSGWNRLQKFENSNTRQDTRNNKNGKHDAIKIGGSKSHQSNILKYIVKQQDPTEIAGLLVGTQTKGFEKERTGHAADPV